METEAVEEQEAVTESPTEPPTDWTTTELPPEEEWQPVVNASDIPDRKQTDKAAPGDSLLLRLARRFTSGNELWDGLVRDCYLKPDVSCFQKNVFSYLDGALDVQDVNVTQRLKFFKNQVDYQVEKEKEEHSEARAGELRTLYNEFYERFKEVLKVLNISSVQYSINVDRGRKITQILILVFVSFIYIEIQFLLLLVIQLF